MPNDTDTTDQRQADQLAPVRVTPLHAHYSVEHLEHVKAEMCRLGPPRLRGYFDTAVAFFGEGIGSTLELAS